MAIAKMAAASGARERLSRASSTPPKMLNRLPRSSACTSSGAALQQQHVAHAQPRRADRARHAAGAMNGQHLQSVSLLEVQAAQALADQRRARQQHAFDDGRLLLSSSGSARCTSALKSSPSMSLILSSSARCPSMTSSSPADSSSSASFLAPAQRLLAAHQLDDRERAVAGDLGSGERLADQRAFVSDENVGLVLAFADLALRLSGPRAGG